MFAKIQVQEITCNDSFLAAVDASV